ncbi:MAG: undecaprenyldiphospho-muramoylpentapeptide beta-N-acetylglucosaminyltransferase [Coriobacteriia bacterium]|nr:undecaprenyldiphospho-muramoylpentapeptide beta-N-acetylglucosaminyltransferase [Coriobacteriia bacterium]
MMVVISTGGTGGHITPALAVAQTLQSRAVDVVFAGTPDSMEERLVQAAGISFQSFAARGLKRKKPLEWPALAVQLMRSRSAARRWLLGVDPQVVATFGGYASLPVGLAANALRLPLLVHEQNARPGLANRLLARRAGIIALSDAAAQGGFRGQAQLVVTGNPLRNELFGISQSQARGRLGLPMTGRLLLVFGGSSGAHHLNDAVLSLASGLLAEFADLTVMHISGEADYEWVNGQLDQAGIAADRWRVLAYCHQMGEAYAAADLVLARAGASSLAEITALGKAALLVPYPYAAADEQTANAERLSSVGAAQVWADQDLEEPGFAELLKNLLADGSLREGLAAQAARLGRPDAAERIADLIMAMSAADGAGRWPESIEA